MQIFARICLIQERKKKKRKYDTGKNKGDQTKKALFYFTVVRKYVSRDSF